jgi:beta-mannosidase
MHLHGPWQYEPLARTVVEGGIVREVPGAVPPPGRLRIPGFWNAALDGLRGRVRWRRPFHGPRALDPNERLWLVFEGADYFARVHLNGRELGAHRGMFDPFEFDVTEQIESHNELVAEIDCPAESFAARPSLVRPESGSAGGLWRPVALEVRSFAYLRHVCVVAALDGDTGVVSARGLVVGEAAVPCGLDLSVESPAGDRDIALSSVPVSAADGGTPFELHVRIASPAIWQPAAPRESALYRVRLELHGMATTLDARDLRVGFRRPFEWAGLRPVPCPLAEVESRLDASDRSAAVWLVPFPFPGGAGSDAMFADDAMRAVQALLCRLAHHPSIAAWTMARAVPFGESIRAAVAASDPHREVVATES